jgi:hypothetical protein
VDSWTLTSHGGYGQIALAALLLTQAAAPGWSQDQQPGQVSNQLTTVHGVVRVGGQSGTGEPLPHALVRINGEAATGVLTDGDGRFEISDVPEGPLDFTVTKPGFLDEVEARADSTAFNAHGYGHNVIVSPGMGDVVFTMQPVNSIHGQIQLSTGDVAEGIPITLLKRIIQDGRAVWQITENTKTNAEGAYRFGGLSDGLYAVFTMPAMDSDSATNLVETRAASRVARSGYPSVFFPDARDLASAAKIRLSGGEQTQANIALTLEPFQPVVATVSMPGSSQHDDNVSVQVVDGQGHLLPYSAQYDPATHTAQAMLPEGTYSLVASMTTRAFRISTSHDSETSIDTRVFRVSGMRDSETVNLTPMGSSGMSGAVTFSVAGRAVSNLTLPLATTASNPVQVTVTRNANAPAERRGPRVNVTLSQTGGWLADGMVSSYAEGSSSNVTLMTAEVQPGSYWVHTNIGPKALCETSFTSGGASLAREPLVLGVAGTTAPLMLSLRDDCAKLTLSLPGSVGLASGMERAYTVYVVPDFDSTEDVVPQTLRPSTGGRISLSGLTPGNYHVYVFDHPEALEYRNPAALAGLRGQPISLSPGADEELTIEVPQT